MKVDVLLEGPEVYKHMRLHDGCSPWPSLDIRNTHTSQPTQLLTYLHIQTHTHTYTDTHTYIDRHTLLTPSVLVLGQAGGGSVYLLPKSPVQIVLDSPTFFPASRTGQETGDRLIIPTIRDFLHVFNAP